MSIDLTIKEAVTDPLIELLLKADGLNTQAFADLLGQAAEEQMRQKLAQLRETHAELFYQRLSATEPLEQARGHC
ncbi:MAG TPA: hypothetical protein VGO22_23350 [Pseudorhizobium sp.]|jgi:hypothetical protein|nr:hypothetical protein [Pseudorhizobium sp.]